MQLANVTVRLGGLITNTVPKVGVTPAEILILMHIHGSDSVVDVRPLPDSVVKGDETLKRRARSRHEQEFERLAQIYDRGAGSFVGSPGDEENRSIMARLFPGAVKKLPETLEEIGITGAAPAEPQPVAEPEAEETADLDEEGGENGAGGDTDAAE